MRFIARSIFGALILSACAAVLMLGWSSYSTAKQSAGDGRPKRAAPERIYTVRDHTLTPITVTPTMTTFGEIGAWRILELRATTAGRIVDIAPDLREGVQTRAGETLVRIDPTNLRSREADTLTVLADARSGQTEANQSFALARADLEAAIGQLKLRRSAVERQKDLASRGIVSAATVETAQLAASTAEQAVVSRRSAYVAAKQRVSQAATNIQRAQLDLESARRDSADTTIAAPFDGLLTEINATLGSLVSANERLARLIDMRSLEASFRVSDAQYARLLTADGKLAPLQAVVTLKLGDRSVKVRATLDRPAAMVGAEGGRTIYARIDASAETPMRPGDFVRVEVTEPPIDQVAEIPARAATEAGEIFLIGEDGRLKAHQAKVLRRLPGTLIVSSVPFGAKIVAERRPQLGEGIKVQSPEEAAAKEAEDRKKRAARRAARVEGAQAKKEDGPKQNERQDGADKQATTANNLDTETAETEGKGKRQRAESGQSERRTKRVNDLVTRRGRRETSKAQTQ